MLNRLLRRRRAKTTSGTTNTSKRLANPESLETRAMLAADAVGDPLLVSDLFSATQLNPLSQVSSIDAMVSGEQQSTVVFHGQGVTSARLPGDDREIFFQQFSDGTASGSVSAANQITRGDQFHARADTAPDGSFWVVWSGRGEGDRHGVFARRFDENGIALTDQVRVNTTRGGDQTRADIGTADNGSAVVVWHGVGTGDFDGVFAQRLAADGSLVGEETLVNQETDDQQAYPVLAVDSDGSFVAAWSSRHQDGEDWGVFARRFGSDGVALDDEFQVAVQTPGSQHLPSIDMDDDGEFVVTWNSSGQDSDGVGVFARQFTADGTPSGETQISNDAAGNQRNSSVAVSNAGEFLISWLQEGSGGWEVVGQTFDSDGSADGDQFTVNTDVSGLDAIANQSPSVAINGFGNSLVAFEGVTGNRQSGIFLQRYTAEVDPPVNRQPTVVGVSNSNASVGELVEILIEASDPNRDDTLSFSLEVNGGTTDLKGATLVDNGDDTATLSWTPTADDRGTSVIFRVIVEDDGDPSMAEATQFTISVENSIPVVNLGNNEQIRLRDGVESILLTTDDFDIVDEDQNNLVTATITIRGGLDADERISIDTAGTEIVATFDNGIMALIGDAPIEDYERVFKTLTYVNDDGGRTSGVRNIDIIVSDGTNVSARVSIAVNVLGQNTAPTLASIDKQEVLIGSPLNLGIDGFDADGDALTYTITSSDPSLVTAELRSGNRSWQLDVEAPAFGIDGRMVFEFFETETPLATGRFIELTQDGFYDGIIFHRVLDGFVIQGGDPLGTGTGGSNLPDYDDQFDVDLQHNATGILSMAKTLDDTNDSQFFVTEGAQRHLDANHTVFGVLTEGEAVRAAISDVTVAAGGRPTAEVTITNAQIINDTQNAAVILRGVDGATGSAEITVTVSDGTNTTSQTFAVDLANDTIDTRPWLDEVPTISTAVDTPTTFQLTGTDVEGDTIRFFGPSDAGAVTPSNQFVVLEPPTDVAITVDSTTGLLTVTPTNGFTGTFEVTVGASDLIPPADTPVINDFQNIEIQIG